MTAEFSFVVIGGRRPEKEHREDSYSEPFDSHSPAPVGYRSKRLQPPNGSVVEPRGPPQGSICQQRLTPEGYHAAHAQA